MEINVLIFLALVSVVACAAALSIALKMPIIRKLPFLKASCYLPWERRVVPTVVCLAVSILAMWLFLSDIEGMPLRAFGDSLLRMLRTFTTDGDITVAILFSDISLVVEQLKTQTGETVATALGFCMKCVAFITLLTAPALTVGALLTLLSQLFPKLKIAVCCCREKYVFSEINEEIVALAESVCEQCKCEKKMFQAMPMLIVTDAYTNVENEKGAELAERLKNIGCICVKDDVTSLKVSSEKQVTYVLADADKTKNLSSALKILHQMGSADKQAFRCQKRMYVFTDLEEAEELLSKECKKLQCKFNDQDNDCCLPIVVPIKEHKNVVYDLFDRVPLFLPLIGKNKGENGKTDLNVTVFGTGRIGTEAFLAALWCGQILDVSLKLTAVSKDADVFRDRLDRIGESILESTDPALHSEPYAGIALIKCDVSHVPFERLFASNVTKTVGDVSLPFSAETFGSACEHLYDTDYFVVSLGEDALNVNTAYLIRRAVERAVLKGERKNETKAIIAVSIYDDAISPSVAYEDEYVRVIPFASFSSRFSYATVINKRFQDSTQNINNTYDTVSVAYSKADMTKIFGKKEKPYDYYKYWSNVGRCLHKKYAMFAAGVTKQEEAENYLVALRDDALCDDLAWMEHRRWNALLWTMGYTRTDAVKNFAAQKVQPCLVDTQRGRHHRLPYKKENGGMVCTLSDEELAMPPYDALDRISADKEYAYGLDVKLYDYPQYSSLVANDRQLALYLGMDADSYQQSKRHYDDYSYELYMMSEDENGEREWTIARYLLDESAKTALDGMTSDEEIKAFMAEHFSAKGEHVYTWREAKEIVTGGCA